jgi:hypothetical protein
VGWILRAVWLLLTLFLPGEDTLLSPRFVVGTKAGIARLGIVEFVLANPRLKYVVEHGLEVKRHDWLIASQWDAYRGISSRTVCG